MPPAPATRVEIAGRELGLSNLDKVLYPRSQTTKAEVIDYYARVGKWMLPHLRGRPVTLRRFPDGVGAEGFFEKKCPKHRPQWVQTKTVRTSKIVDHCLLEEPAALVWTANLAALELHVPMGRVPDIACPTGVVFDLDPGAPAGMEACVEVALVLRDLLANAGLRAVVKGSGSKGLHLGVPLNTATNFDATRDFAAAVARLLTTHMPDRVTDVMSKAQRPGKVFIDWSQNTFTKTTVCAYSLRATEVPHVSAPLTWAEVEAAAAGPATEAAQALTFGPAEVLARCEADGDAFAGWLEWEQSLPELA
ncbi:MAG: non-homologous end-joining DNA ligase [Acidimicrobiia bacterium]|nr:non-homologous end-joining DNA ligase [Acidimicrobiia bacterium]